MKIAALIILSLLPVVLSEESLSTDKADESVRVKRAGFSLITGALQNLQKSAFGASASLAAGSSSSASGSSGSGSSGSSGSHEVHSHTYSHSNNDYDEPHHDTKSFDGWTLKKSILNTLLQAVKAIAGGVTTLKGQLIKGSGYLVTQKGKLIISGGEAVSNAGKNIVESAHLIKPETSGHGGGQSIGHSLGAKFSGLTKSISGLSSGSSGSITSLSSSSSSSSSGHSSNSDNGAHQGDAYAAVEGPSYSYNIPEPHSYDSYGPPKVVHNSYGPPKPTISYLHEPHSSYGAPEFNDASSNHDASDILSHILKNMPVKPVKSVGYELVSDGHGFKQIPIPDDIPPPFKPLSDFQSFNVPFESSKINSQYGAPNHYSDYSGQASNDKPIFVNPKAYNIYHTMKMKLTKDKNFVTLPTIDDKGLEIHKSIGFEIKA